MKLCYWWRHLDGEDKRRETNKLLVVAKLEKTYMLMVAATTFNCFLFLWEIAMTMRDIPFAGLCIASSRKISEETLIQTELLETQQVTSLPSLHRRCLCYGFPCRKSACASFVGTVILAPPERDRLTSPAATSACSCGILPSVRIEPAASKLR